MGSATVPGPDEAGFSIIETVVALAILLLIIPSLMGGLYIAVASSRRQSSRAVAVQLAMSAAEAVKADQFDPLCPAYSPAAVPVPVNWSVTTSCQAVAGQPVAFPLQAVTVTVVAPVGSATATTSLVVVKSNRQ